MHIEISDLSVSIQRKRIKNINLRIKRTGEVQISAPVKTPIEVIRRFLHNKRTWIEMHRYRLLQLEQEQPQQVMAGEYVNFLGTKYPLQLHETDKNQRIELKENQLHLYVKPKTSQVHKQDLLKKWYHSQMQQYVPSLLNKWQSIMGVTVNKISIKHMKSRWGSCNPVKKNITLNLCLIEKPLICLEYVIVHELVHLFESSHNQHFYALMSHYLPHWKQIKKQLTERIGIVP
jgi:predicted metal-dependent hydrolase